MSTGLILASGELGWRVDAVDDAVSGEWTWDKCKQYAVGMGHMEAVGSMHGTYGSRVLHLSAEGAPFKFIDLNQLAGPLE